MNTFHHLVSAGTRWARSHSQNMRGVFAGLAIVGAGTTLCYAAPPAMTSVSGSPFVLSHSVVDSNVVLLSPDEKHLFVSNQGSNTLTVANVAAGGALSFNSAYLAPVTSPSPASAPVGLAMNPAGTRLYAAICGDAVAVYDVNPTTGALALRQTASLGADNASCPLNGIVYVTRGAADYLYVNNGWDPNTVTSFQVNADGSLTRLAVTNTGGSSGGGGLYAAPSLRSLRVCPDGCHLFVANGSTYGGSSDISVFAIGADGGLSAVVGSPFPLPGTASASGALALSPDDTTLYAGTLDGQVVPFSVAPDGTLSAGSEVALGGPAFAVDGLEVNPCGDFLVATFDPDQAGSNQLTVLNTHTLQPVPGSPVTGDGAGAAGLTFNQLGTRLFAGNSNDTEAQVSVYQFNAYGDTTPPSCTLTAQRAGPPVQVDLTVRDTGSGVRSIQVTRSTNCTVFVPSFTPGTTQSIVVTATKTNPTQSSTIGLEIIDCAGNVTDFDPVVAELRIPHGKSRVTRVYRGIPPNESLLRVQNGSPGASRLQVLVDGTPAGSLTLAAGSQSQLDLSPRMRRAHNQVAVVVTGQPGSSALITIGDTTGAATGLAALGRGQAVLDWGD